MEPDNQAEKESRRRGIALNVLQQMPEWLAVVEIFESYSKLWRANLLRIEEEDSIEKIAKDRLKWLYRLNGIETLFTQIAEDIEVATKEEEEEDEPENKNPFRKEFNE